jgi:TolA-binding protein
MYPYNSLVDDILFRKAKIETEQKNYVLAADYLQKIVDGFSYDLLGDDATFMLADLFNNKLNKKEEAKNLYKEILTRYPGSVFTEESREKYRELRAIYPDKESQQSPEEQFFNGNQNNEIN